MLFNSFTFVIFFPIVLIISRSIGSWTYRKFFLLIASYAFYAAWNPPFVVLLWISTIVDWFAARLIEKYSSTFSRRFYLSISLLVNLGMLGYFKYGGFLLDNFISFVHTVGIDYHPAKPSIILPVGISFYTFQTLSYTFDVFKRKMKPWHSFLDYALYVTFFPQLVAGPIVRAVDFLPQCEEPKKSSDKQLGWGLTLLTIGLFNKVVIADAFMAPIVEKVYDSPEMVGFFQAWAGTLGFATQIFCDFAGYSTCAIGIAMALGFVLPDNFRFPYAAVGFSDFWRRWHISLSSWLRDYLYISLGGNRKGGVRTYINLIVTMLLGGLWHGASWMFVIWGGLHGLYLILERLVKHWDFAQHSIWSNPFVRFCLSLLTFFLVCITWVFFRAKEFSRALAITLSMLGVHSSSFKSELWLPGNMYIFVAGCTLGMLFIHHFLRNRTVEDLFGEMPWWVKSVVVSALAYCVLISFTGEDRAFIYFQF